MRYLKTFTDIYNAGVWLDYEGKTHLLGREVTQKDQHGKPDVEDLILVTIDKLGHIAKQKVWDAKSRHFFLEDPRALVTKNNGKLQLGFTAVLPQKQGNLVPFPAILELPLNNWSAPLPPEQIRVLTEMGPGKNITPLSENMWMFRIEGNSHNQTLTFVRIEDTRFETVKEIDFTAYSFNWAKWRIGTTFAPVLLDSVKGILFIHGITQTKAGYYRYSLGRAVIDLANYTILTIDQKAFLKPEDFTAPDGSKPYQELHPFREVIYLCGGIVDDIGKTVSLYVNVGDTQTVEVEVTFAELTRGLI